MIRRTSFISRRAYRQLFISLAAAILLVLGVVGRCSAYGNGLIPLPAYLKNYRTMMLQAPQQCSQALEQQLTPRVGEVLVFSDASEPIILHQIAALCSWRAHHLKRAYQHIDEAIRLALDNNIPLLSIRSYLIRSQLNLASGERNKQAQDDLNNAQKLQHQSSDPLPLLLNYQWQQTQARLLMAEDQYVAAKSYLANAKEMSQTADNPLMQGWNELFWGRYYQQLNQPLQALSHYTAAIRFASAKRTEVDYLRSRLNFHLSEVYQQQQQWDKALEYQKMAIESAQQVNNQELIASNIARLASIYRDRQQFSLALVHYLNAQEMARNNQLPLLVAKINYWLGQTYTQLNDYEQALQHFNEAQLYFKRRANIRWLSATLISLAQIYIGEDEPAMAILQLSKAEQLAAHKPQAVDQALLQLTLARTYEHTGSFSRALEHYKQFEQFNQARIQHQFETTQQQFSQNYQFIEQQQQLAKLTQENQRLQLQGHERRLITLLLTIATGVFFLLLIWVRFRLKKVGRANKDLTERLYYHPRTGWPALEVSESPLTQLRELELYPMLQNGIPAASHYVMVIRLSELSFSHKSCGFEQRKQLETSLAHHIYHHLEDKFMTGHLGGLNYLFITPVAEESPQALCQQLTRVLEQFIQMRKLALTIAIGCCQTPFLSKATDAIDDQGIIDISYLAMDAALDQVKQNQSNQWVILQALACTSAASFRDSEKLADNIRLAIQQGWVKVETSTDKRQIKW